MDHKQANEILIKILKKYEFSPEEKEAIMTAIGILSWTSLSESTRKAIKAKQEKNKNK